jgi:hypothetical protein
VFQWVEQEPHGLETGAVKQLLASPQNGTHIYEHNQLVTGNESESKVPALLLDRNDLHHLSSSHDTAFATASGHQSDYDLRTEIFRHETDGGAKVGDWLCMAIADAGQPYR